MSTVSIKSLNHGDRIEMVTAFGSGKRVIGTVEEVDMEGKGGRPIVFVYADGEELWAYADQIIRKLP